MNSPSEYIIIQSTSCHYVTASLFMNRWSSVHPPPRLLYAIILYWWKRYNRLLRSTHIWIWFAQVDQHYVARCFKNSTACQKCCRYTRSSKRTLSKREVWWLRNRESNGSTHRTVCLPLEPLVSLSKKNFVCSSSLHLIVVSQNFLSAVCVLQQWA